MRKKTFRTVCFTVVIFLMTGFVSEAQELLYKTEKENGKVVSQTKCVLGYLDMRVKESESKYIYDEAGNLLKKEVCVWNPKYKRIGRDKCYPDYSESNWTPKYCILYKKDSTSDSISVEFLLWNKKKKAYDDPGKTMIFRLDNAKYSCYLEFLNKSEYYKGLNDIKFDRKMLASLAE